MLRRSEADLDAEDTFLPLVLGILSATRRWGAILNVLAPPVNAKANAGAAGKVPVEDITLLLLLGIVSISERARASIEEAPPARPERANMAVNTPTLPTGTLLR